MADTRENRLRLGDVIQATRGGNPRETQRLLVYDIYPSKQTGRLFVRLRGIDRRPADEWVLCRLSTFTPIEHGRFEAAAAIWMSVHDSYIRAATCARASWRAGLWRRAQRCRVVAERLLRLAQRQAERSGGEPDTGHETQLNLTGEVQP